MSQLTYIIIKNGTFSDNVHKPADRGRRRGRGSAHEETQTLCDVGSRRRAVTPARPRGTALNPPQTADGTCSLALPQLPQPFLKRELQAL